MSYVFSSFFLGFFSWIVFIRLAGFGVGSAYSVFLSFFWGFLYVGS